MLKNTREITAKVNSFLTGFRTVLVALAGFAIVFVDAFLSNLGGFSSDYVKGAAVVAGLVTLKQIKTDIIPRINGRLNK